MATSSRYNLLSSSVLMEYVYSDRSQLNVPGNPFQISTATNPIWMLSGQYNGVSQILNSDANELIQTGTPVGTGNVRNRSFVYTSSYKGALLDIDKVVFYNDYDQALTSTLSLPVLFTNPQAPVYDTIKLHLVQGFNFEDHLGLTLTVKCKMKSGGELILANLVYLKEDLWETLNPSSFFFAGRVYDSYLEIRLLSLYDLVYDYWIGTLTGDTTVERITDGDGVERNPQIQVSFSWIRNKTRIDDQDYIEMVDRIETDLPIRDQFESISAVIQESTDADYIEFYAAFNGAIIENYILDLNRSGGDYIIIHDLIVYEYIDNGDGTYSWIATDTIEISQTDDFDLPKLFRPIIKNGSAVAYKIDYIARLFNRNDQTQIWKTASMISYGANKYGRKLKSINLGYNPTIQRIYNKNSINTFNLVKAERSLEVSTRYLTSFISNHSVSASFQVYGQGSTGQLNPISTIGKDRIWENGLARIFIPISTNYIKFVLSQKNNESNDLLNLNNVGKMELAFSSENADEIAIQEFPSETVSKTGGEVIFRITETQSKQILNLTDRSFRIFLVAENGEKTFVYSGKFFSLDEYQALVEADKITELESLISGQNNQIGNLSALIQTQQEQISDLLNQVSGLSGTVSSDETLIQTLKTTIQNLQNQINTIRHGAITTINQVNDQIGLSSIRPPVDITERIAPSFIDDELARNKVTIHQTKESPYTSQRQS